MLEYSGRLSVSKCRMARSSETLEEEQDKALTVLDLGKKAGRHTMGIKNQWDLLKQATNGKCKNQSQRHLLFAGL